MPVMHFSFDDIAYSLHDLCVNPYASAFDQPFLRDLRVIHRETGAVFTLFCFNRFGKIPGYDIANLPDRYHTELAAESHWLRFGFHAEDDASKYAHTPGALESFLRCTEALTRFAGEGSIDSFLRLGFFSGSEESVRALQGAGLRGLYAADDDRLSYCLDQQENDTVIREGAYRDSQGMLYVRTLPRLDRTTAEEIIAVIESNPAYRALTEVFMHEYVYLSDPETFRERIAAIARWTNGQGYTHRFHSDEVIA